MGAGCRAEFWRTGRPDSRDAQDTGGRKNWISETRFLHALNYCTLVLVRKHTNWPSISAGYCIAPGEGLLPGYYLFCGLLATGTLSWIYASYGQIGIVRALFLASRLRCLP